MIRRPPRSPLFPSTTLSRSLDTSPVASLLRDPGLRELVDSHLEPVTVSAVADELEMDSADVVPRITAFSIATRLLPPFVYRLMEVSGPEDLLQPHELLNGCRAHCEELADHFAEIERRAEAAQR